MAQHAVPASTAACPAARPGGRLPRSLPDPYPPRRLHRRLVDGRPALQAVAAGASAAPPDRLALAVVWLVAGTALLVSGFASIGVASAGFLYEYVDAPQPIVARGIYRYVRHPLFLGGVVASIGAALAFETQAGLLAAAVNVAVLPAYRLLEDRRLIGVFGPSYRAYCSEVAAFVPKLPTLQAALRR